MDLSNYTLDQMDIVNNTLIITSDDGTICIPEENCTLEEANIFSSWREKYPTGKPVIVDLDALKQSKIAELSNACNSSIINGFYSDADGSKKLYDFELENQINIATKAYQIQLSQLAGKTEGNINYYAKGGECHDYTPEQFLKLAADGEAWKTKCITLYKDTFKPKVAGCTTAEEVNEITWSIDKI